MTHIKKLTKWVLPILILMSAQTLNTGCKNAGSGNSKTDTASVADSFKVEAEAFADLQLLRYQVPGFSDLSLQQKKLAYYLYEAALSGRDIIYDQKSKYGILLRKTLEAIYGNYKGDRHNSNWKNSRNIVAGYGSAMATTTIMAMKNSFPNALMNFLKAL